VKIRWICCMAAAPLAMLLITGCAPKPQAEAPGMSVEELMAQWHDLAAAPFEEMDEQSAQIIATKLAAKPGGKEALLAVLADPASTPQAKILAMISLQPVLTPDMEPRLAELTQPTQDPTTRATALQLLGAFDSDFARKRISDLLDDDAHTIRVTALALLLEAGRFDVLDRVDDLLADPATTNQDRARLISVLPATYYQTNPEVFFEALKNEALPPPVRAQAAGVLAFAGDDAAVAALRDAAENDPDETVRELAEAGLAMIAREAGTPELGQDAETPDADSDAPEVEVEAAGADTDTAEAATEAAGASGDTDPDGIEQE
jgi:HEAT repeat protein